MKFVGEAASADYEASAIYPGEFIIRSGYEPEQFFNADETGFFWKRMPSTIFISNNENTAPGFNACKYRLRLLLCANAGGNMIKPIHKSLNARAVKGKSNVM